MISALVRKRVKILKQNGFNFLWVDNYLWMWDIPVERKAQKELADKAFGDVLVAGYGLGMVQKYLSRNPKVKSIITVEKLPEVIKEVKRVYKKIYGDVVIDDFYKYRTDRKFDCVIGDVWEDIAEEFLYKYKKFVKKAESFIKKGGKILAWGQEFFEALKTKNKIWQ